MKPQTKRQGFGPRISRRQSYRECATFKCATFKCATFKCATFKCATFKCATFKCATFKCATFKCVSHSGCIVKRTGADGLQRKRNARGLRVLDHPRARKA